jgi:hypothetical protein
MKGELFLYLLFHSITVLPALKKQFGSLERKRAAAGCLDPVIIRTYNIDTISVRVLFKPGDVALPMFVYYYILYSKPIPALLTRRLKR